MTVCRFHPDQPAVGLCVRCRAPICAGCCTQLDGINHCHECLEAMATRPAKPRRQASPLVSAGLVLVLLWAIMFGMLELAQGALMASR